MTRAYNVVDADGHVLEPVNLWDHYIDPAFRDRRPQRFIDSDGKDRLKIDGKAFGGKKGIGALGAVGARDGVVCDDTLAYEEGRPGGFDPHKRIPDMDADGIDAAFLYPSLGLFSGAIHDPALAAAVCGSWMPPKPRHRLGYRKAASIPSRSMSGMRLCGSNPPGRPSS